MRCPSFGLRQLTLDERIRRISIQQTSTQTDQNNALIGKKRCSRPFQNNCHQLRGHHLLHHIGGSSERPHSLVENIKLNAHGRHYTTYPLCFLLFFNFLLLFIFCFFLFSSVTLVLWFLGTKGTLVQVWGCAMSHANLDSSPSPRSTLSMLSMHWGQCVL